MPSVNELLDAIRTGSVNVRDYILILHPEHYNTLLASLHSAAIRDGVREDPRFFGFEIRVDPSFARDEVGIVRRAPLPFITSRSLEFNLDDLRLQVENFYDGPHIGHQTFSSTLAPEIFWSPPGGDPGVPRQPPKTLWEHLEDDIWDEE